MNQPRVELQPGKSSRPDASAARPKSPKRGPNPRILIPIVALVVAGVSLGYWYWNNPPEGNELKLSGRLEGYETDIGAKAVGRVDVVSVREGDAVRRGQLLVKLDDAELRAQIAGTFARLASAKQRERQAQLQLDVLAGQVSEARFTLTQARGDAQGRIDQAEATVAQGEAQLAQAQAQRVQSQSELKLARLNRDRYAELKAEGAVTTQEFDQAQTSFETAEATLLAREAAVEAARKQVAASRGALVQTRTASINPSIRGAQLDVINKQRSQALSQLEAATADVENARAAREEFVAQRAYLNVVSPMNGVVTARSVEPGAVVTTGKTLMTLIDLSTVYLRGYIPEGKIGRVRVGQSARVYLDSSPDRPLDARVSAIDPQASFTPENIYFRDERVKQVFGVKLSITNPGGFAKPGMPADGEILLDDVGPDKGAKEASR